VDGQIPYRLFLYLSTNRYIHALKSNSSTAHYRDIARVTAGILEYAKCLLGCDAVCIRINTTIRSTLLCPSGLLPILLSYALRYSWARHGVLFCREDGGITFIWKVGTMTSDYKARHSRTQQSSWSPPWELKTSLQHVMLDVMWRLGFGHATTTGSRYNGAILDAFTNQLFFSVSIWGHN
jgi:hypothetical protein